MDFTLFYQGPLKANGNLKHKHTLRRVFHAQLQQLWGQSPLSYRCPPEGHFLDDDPPPTELSIIQKLGDFRFAPLVTSRLHLNAKLDITLLRPASPGGFITQGGDIDNRLKTLLDSLRMPHDASELPRQMVPTEGENPFFCLLEDDSLITGLSVDTDRLLERGKTPSDVVLLIRVHTITTIVTCANIDLA